MLGQIEASSLDISVIIVVDDMNLFIIRVIRLGMIVMAIGVAKPPSVHDDRSIGLIERHFEAIIFVFVPKLLPVSLLWLVLDDKVHFLILLVKIKEAR